MIFDAVCARLIEIGEAAGEPAIPCKDIARVRVHPPRRYLDTDHAIVGVTVEHDLPPLVEAAERLRQMVEPEK